MKWIGVVLAVLLVLSACSSQTATQEVAPAPSTQEAAPTPTPVETATSLPSPVVSPPSEAVKPEPTPVAEPQPAAEPASATTDYDPKVKALLDLATTKFKTAQYEFVGPGDVPPGNIYRVRGTLIKIVKQRPLELKDMANYYDTVYLDTTTKTATGYCTDAWGKKDCIVMNKKYEGLDYAQYMRKTPFEWIPEIDKSAKVTGTQVLNGKDTKKLEFDKNGMHYTFLLDKIYGAPVFVSKVASDQIDVPDAYVESYEYGAFIGNGVTQADVTPPAV